MIKKKSTSQKGEQKPVLNHYFLPELGRSVEAESLEQAIKLATIKQESGDEQ